MERTGIQPQLVGNCVLNISGDVANIESALSENTLYSDAKLVRYYSMNDLVEKNGFNLTNSGCASVSGKFVGAYSTGENNISNGMYNTANVGIDGGPVTVCAWIKTLSNHKGNNPYNFAVWESSPANYVINGITFNQTNSTVGFMRLRSVVAWEGTVVGFSATPGTWNHYAMTFDGGTVRGYINGVLVGSSGAGGNGATDTFRAFGVGIGNNVVATNEDASSIAVDEIAVFSRALSGAEILEISGYTVALDISGNGNHGTLVNSPSVKRRMGYKGFAFNGIDQYAYVNDDNSFDFGTGDFSISFTVNFDNTNQSDLANQFDLGSLTGWYVSRNGTDTSKIEVGFYNSGNSSIFVSNAGFFSLTGVPMRVTVVRRNSGTIVDVYRNGALFETSSAITARNVTNSGTVKFGTNSNASGSFLQGKIFNQLIHNYALSKEAIELDALASFIP